MNVNRAALQAGANVPAGRSVLDIAADTEKREGLLRHLEATGKKRHEGREYAEMEAYLLSDDCAEDLRRLRQADFFFAPPFHYRVPKNASGAMRDVYAFKGREKYLLRLIAWVMHDYDDALPQGLYSFRRSVQARDFLKKVRNFKDFEKYYIVKADVSNYVGSIVPEKIIPQLEVLWQHDPALLSLLKFLLLRRECIDRGGNVAACEPGGMGGIPVANYFMNVYLIELDRYFYDIAPLYSRYSDDVVILARDLPEAEAYRERFLQILQERQLVTNPKKTRLLMPGESVELLGYKVCRGKIDISDHAMEKVKRKLRVKSRKLLQTKRRERLTDAQAAQQMIDYCNFVLYGDAGKHELSWARWYFPVLNTADGLREVDRYAQDAIRFVMCGSLRRKRYGIRYEELRALGYKSLVHAYYHFDPVAAEQAEK